VSQHSLLREFRWFQERNAILACIRRPDECWALEYARGHIPTMMPFGLWDTFFSTVDFYTMWQTVRISASQMLAHALQGKF
jgi:C-8 sterol isomerase